LPPPLRTRRADTEEQITIAIESCPVDCIYWVKQRNLPILEYAMQRCDRQTVGLMNGGNSRVGLVVASLPGVRLVTWTIPAVVNWRWLSSTWCFLPYSLPSRVALSPGCHTIGYTDTIMALSSIEPCAVLAGGGSVRHRQHDDSQGRRGARAAGVGSQHRSGRWG
jgi:hypothetical protein